MCFVDNETFTSTYSDLQHYDTEFLTIYADAHTLNDARQIFAVNISNWLKQQGGS